MFEQLDSRSPTPLYDQIAARIRVAVAAGDLNAGDALPSVRNMASELRVNPATVVQAYRALESEGFLEMRQGAGTFIKEVGEAMLESERRAAADRLVERMIVEAGRLGLKRDALANAVAQEFGGA